MASVIDKTLGDEEVRRKHFNELTDHERKVSRGGDVYLSFDSQEC